MASYGSEEFIDAGEALSALSIRQRWSFDTNDLIFGPEIPLMRLVSFFQDAAQGYGTEKRVLLLHGPVGSSKSTIVRRLKRGLEHYARAEDGALYTFDWYLGTIDDNWIGARFLRQSGKMPDARRCLAYHSQRPARAFS